MSFTDQDLFGQALEDALEVLQQESDYANNNYMLGDYNDYLTYHHDPFQTNTNNLAESSTEKTVHNWKNSINDADWYCTLCTIPESQEMYPTAPQQKSRRGRKKLRLFEYLIESLHNPDMANCIQWIDEPNGIFQFISKNKEKLAEQWGERKGNRKVMTYQKMARALRNYGRTGEVFKIRRKLTYQFGAVVFQRLPPGKDRNIDDQYSRVQQEPPCVAADCLTYQYCVKSKGCEIQHDSSFITPFYYES